MFQKLPDDIKRFIYKYDDEIEAKIVKIKLIYLESELDDLHRKEIKNANIVFVLQKIKNLVKEKSLQVDKINSCDNFIKSFRQEETESMELKKRKFMLEGLIKKYDLKIACVCPHNDIRTIYEYDSFNSVYANYCNLCDQSI